MTCEQFSYMRKLYKGEFSSTKQVFETLTKKRQRLPGFLSSSTPALPNPSTDYTKVDQQKQIERCKFFKITCKNFSELLLNITFY